MNAQKATVAKSSNSGRKWIVSPTATTANALLFASDDNEGRKSPNGGGGAVTKAEAAAMSFHPRVVLMAHLFPIH